MFRSVRSIVMAPARTGRDKSRRRVVTEMDQTNRGMRAEVSPLWRMFLAVVRKLTDLRMEETPARWREKIARSTEGPLWEIFLARGGYTVQPVPAPCSTTADITRRVSEGGSSQKLMLFKRGNAMSGAASMRGTSQLPKPPMKTGITRKKIIRKACAVTRTL